MQLVGGMPSAFFNPLLVHGERGCRVGAGGGGGVEVCGGVVVGCGGDVEVCSGVWRCVVRCGGGVEVCGGGVVMCGGV